MARKTAKTTKTTRAPVSTGKSGTRTRSSTKRSAAPNGSSGRALVIVESPKKAKSIGKFLGAGYTVRASMGHVRDLPERGSALGIDVDHGYKPTYVVSEKKKKTVSELKKEAERAAIVYLATDPDREGEAIAWHLQHALGLSDDQVGRVLFFEITEKAVLEAMRHVTPIDQNKVNAQQARRFLDRFVGYQVSPLLWKKVARGLSAGRVQSVAVRLIAEREKEIQAFVTEEYWKITATLSPSRATATVDRFAAELAEWKGGKFEARTEAESRAIVEALEKAAYSVSKLEKTERRDKPEAPFKTSTLQQQASVRLRFSGKKTMKLAQDLYEGIDVDGSGPVGLITYMRTDSLRVSDDALGSVRRMIETEFGPRYLPDRPNRFAAGKMAQEAHEAIRPTDLSYHPDRIKDKLPSNDHYRLYSLIYRRFVASQMTPAVFEITNVEVRAGEGLFRTQGKILRFDGYRRVLAPAGKQEDQLLPALADGMPLDLHELAPSQHFTQPPPRYSEATLVKALEKENIGRPSTYAPIIQTIQDRGYVEQKERRFFATPLGMTVTDLLVEHFPKIMDLKFTAHMEDELDDIVTGKEDMVRVLDEFYHPFQEALKVAEERMQRVQIATDQTCHECGAPMVIKFGRTGQFLSCSKYPDCKATRPVGSESKPEAIETEHKCPKCGRTLLQRENKRGPYLACSGYPECKEIFNLDASGNPVPTVIETDHLCPKCGKNMALRQGPRGPFLGCTGYPKCRTTLPVDDQGNPVQAPEIHVKCEKCGGPMGLKQGRRGAFLGCLAYPKCRSTAPIPDDLKDQVAAAMPAPATSGGADLKSIAVEETCEKCGGPMLVRRSKRGYFLGCAGYPKCRGTREPGEATLEKIRAATGESG